MSDHLTGIFDHLDPDDFSLTRTSAIDDVPGTFMGQTRFTQFVDEQMHAVRVGFTASDGQLNPVAVIASPTVQRVFTPDDEEVLGEFIERIRREARLIKAHWLFYAMLTESAQIPGVSTDLPADGEELQQVLDARGDDVEDVIMWYAQAVGRTNEIRAGVIPIAGNRLNLAAQRTFDQPVQTLASILQR